MEHPEPTVKLAHQILQRIRAELPDPDNPHDLYAHTADEYTEMFNSWGDLESTRVAESVGLVLTALMVATDISGYMARVVRDAPRISARLEAESRARFWTSLKAAQLDVMTHGDVTDSHASLSEWEQIAFRPEPDDSDFTSDAATYEDE